MKNNNIKYFLSIIVGFAFSIQCLAQANIVVSGANISPAPAVFPNGGQETFKFTVYNDGDPTNSAAVQIKISLSNLDFTASTFNVNTDIFQTGTTPFTWSYNATTKTLTATLNGTFESSLAPPFPSNSIEIRNLNVLSASSQATSNVGANVNVFAPTAVNSSTTDDNTPAFTYTTTVLPIELLSFEASAISGCSEKLAWSTGGNSNFSHFQLEQSLNSKEFTAVGEIQKNKGLNTRYEQIVDINSVKSNAVYFRLKMVDVNNTVNYSKILSIQNDCSKKNNVSVSPNPAKDFITVSQMNSKGKLYIFDILGRLVLSVPLSENPNQNVNVSQLVEGTYMVQVASEQGIFYSKMVKQ